MRLWAIIGAMTLGMVAIALMVTVSGGERQGDVDPPEAPTSSTGVSVEVQKVGRAPARRVLDGSASQGDAASGHGRVNSGEGPESERESFSIEGRVYLEGGGQIPGGVTVLLRLYHGGLEVAACDPVPVSASGTFESTGIQLTEGDSWAVVVFGGGVEPVVQPIRTPGPGAVVAVEVSTRIGSTVDLVVRDAQGAALSGVSCSVRIEPGGAWTPVSETDFDGETVLDGLPSGGDLTISLQAKGYETLLVGPYVLPLDRERLEVVLQPAGTLAVQVSDESGPVEDFELVYWVGAPDSPEYRTFRGAKEGVAELEGVPFGVISVLAFSKKRVQSQTASVELTPDRPNEVSLELRIPRIGFGRVVDGASHRPITNATVEPYATAGGRFLTGWAGPQHVDQDGSFRIAAFPPGDARMIVDAPGYEFEMVVGGDRGRGEVDFGVIPLYRSRTLTVKLSASGVDDYSGFYVSTAWARENPWKACDSNGVVEFPDCVAGTYEFMVFCPSGAIYRFSRSILDGDEWNVLHRIPSGVELRVAILRDGESVGPGVGVVALGQGGLGGALASHSQTDADGVATLYDVIGEIVVIEVYDQANNLAALERELLGVGPTQRLTVELGGDDCRIRVVDPAGRPVAGVEVRASCSDAPGWHGWSDTDLNGVATVHAPSREVTLKLVHDERGQQSGVSVLLSSAPEEVTDVVFDPVGVVRVRVVDVERPVTGVKVWLRHVSDDTYSEPRRPDADGIVEWQGVGRGRFVVVGSAPGYCGVPALVEAGSGSQEPFKVQLRRSGGLRVSVSGGGREVLRVDSLEGLGTVEEWMKLGLVQSNTSTMVPDGDGSLVLRGLPHGQYAVRYGGLEKSVAVPVDGVAVIDIKLP